MLLRSRTAATQRTRAGWLMLEQPIRARGRTVSGKSPLSSGGGGEVGSFLYACFIIYTCLLLWLRLIWDTLYSISSIETLARSPMYDGVDATSDFPSLLLWSVSTNFTRLSLANVTPITVNYVRREMPKWRQIWKHNVGGSLSAQARCTEGRLKVNSHITCRAPAVLWRSFTHTVLRQCRVLR